MGNRNIKIGIIGSGGYGGTARGHLNDAGGFDIVACMDVSKSAAVAAAKAEQAEAYTDLDAFFAHDGMEAVSINTPALLHYEHCIRSLKDGMHVMVTKPVTNNSAEALKIRRQAERKNLVCMVGQHAKHHPEFEFVRSILQSDRLGRVCNGSILSCSSSGLWQKAGDWRAIADQNPGGPMLQCGIHSIDFLLSVFGPIESVTAVMQDDVTKFGVVDNAMTLLQFANGMQMSMVMNYTTAYMHTMDFFGTKANLHMHSHITGLGQREIYIQPCGKGLHEPWRALRIPTKQSVNLERLFADQIRAGKPDYSNFNGAIDALKVVEAAVKSSETGRAVKVRQTA